MKTLLEVRIEAKKTLSMRIQLIAIAKAICQI